MLGSGHFIFIPGVLLIGAMIGFVLGMRAQVDQAKLEAKREQEREEAREARKQRKAAKADAAAAAEDESAAEAQ